MVKPIAIVGGGLAGGLSALLLARAGKPVTLLEREAGPHDKVCGEFLSVEACGDLQRAGIDLPSLGAVPLRRVRVASGQRLIESPLPFTAQSLSRRILDEVLLEAASGAGAEVLRGVRVSGVSPGEVRLGDDSLTASAILLASGKHDIRGASRAAPATRSGYVGFKMHYRAAPALAESVGDAIELVLFDGGYAGLQRVAPDVLNLCLILRSATLAESGGNWDGVLARMLREPWLERRLSGAEPLFPRPLTIANLPYGYVFDPAETLDGIWRLGDQAAMTASITGDGMAGALRSAGLAAQAIIAGRKNLDYHRSAARELSPQIRRAMALQRLTEHPMLLGCGLMLLRMFPALIGRLAKGTRLKPTDLSIAAL